MIPLRTSTGTASDVTVAAKPRPSVIMAGRPNRIWSRSRRSARSRGRDPHGRHLDPVAVDELPLGGLEVGPELGDRLVDGVDGVVADLGLAASNAVGMLLDVRRTGAVTVGPALLRPVALPRLDYDRAVGGDAVTATQLAQAHGAGDVLALERQVVTDPVRGRRLRLLRPPAAPRRDEGLTESPSGVIVARDSGATTGGRIHARRDGRSRDLAPGKMAGWAALAKGLEANAGGMIPLWMTASPRLRVAATGRWEGACRRQG